MKVACRIYVSKIKIGKPSWLQISWSALASYLQVRAATQHTLKAQQEGEAQALGRKHAAAAPI